MGVVNRLNALDERAGVRGPIGARRWDARLRLWWAGIAIPYGVMLVVLGWEASNDGTATPAVALALLPGAFYGGFLYNERLRALGRRPRLMEVPSWWPEEHPDTPDVASEVAAAPPPRNVTA